MRGISCSRWVIQRFFSYTTLYVATNRPADSLCIRPKSSIREKIMRTFEILLTLLSFIMLFQQKMPRKLAAAIGFASMGVLAGQLFFEGYRWQMFFVYLISAALAFTAIFGKRLQIRMWKPLKYGLYVLTFAMLAISAFLSVYLPVFDLPSLTAPIRSGRKRFI